MITIESPSMVLNDARAPTRYVMDVTRTVSPGVTMRKLVDMVLVAATTVPGGVFHNLILHGHGGPGTLQIGTGLGSGTMGPFADIAGVVRKVWFKGCLIARIIGPETASQGDGTVLAKYGFTSGHGHHFVSGFARLTHCWVVAATEMQGVARREYPQGMVDTYEGLVLCYNPSGHISWQRNHRSLHGYNAKLGTAISPNGE